MPHPSTNYLIARPRWFMGAQAIRGRRAEAPSLLAGLIVNSDGNRMAPTHAKKRAKRYRYYVSASLLAGDHSRAQKGMRIPAGDIEALVRDRLRALLSSQDRCE